MTFRDYFRSLSTDAQEEYAKRAGTTANYIRCHLVSDRPRKVPRRELMESLAAASGGHVSVADLVRHFYPEVA